MNPASSPTKRMTKPAVGTWDISEKRDEVGRMVITLKIQGSIYAEGRALSRVDAYKELLNEVATPLSRSVTIARLMGGEL